MLEARRYRRSIGVSGIYDRFLSAGGPPDASHSRSGGGLPIVLLNFFHLLTGLDIPHHCGEVLSRQS